jgi:phosphatidylglycerol:prolipoprotein diacylglycerol transferase
MPHGALTIGISPTVDLGPLVLTWHGIMTAAGLVAGTFVAARIGAAWDLRQEEILNAVVVVAIAGVLGARLFYLVGESPEDLLTPTAWPGTRGFAFYGAIILGVPAVALYLWRRQLGLRYLDALAIGFPAGLAVGRLGDLMIGEHHGPPSSAPWAIRYTHPEAEVPSAAVAYHSGALYEIILALAIFIVALLMRGRWRQPGLALCSVVALYGAGRFAMFFYRSDSQALAAGLNAAQWTSLGLVASACLGAWFLRRSGSSRSAISSPS